MFKLFGGKKTTKKEGYFLELKEETDKAPVVEEAKTHIVEEVKTPVVETAQQNGKNGKVKIPIDLKGKKSKSAPAETVEQPKTTPAPQAVVKEEPKQVNFATEYILTQTFSRRLPGPSLNNFKNMARQIKK